MDLCYLLNDVFSSLSDDGIDFNFSVTNIQPDQVTLTFVANFIRCYNFSCVARDVGAGKESSVFNGITATPYVIHGLAENSTYQISCTATRGNKRVTRLSELFTTS